MIMRYPAKQRQLYIAILVQTQGHVSRKDIVDRFEVGVATATRDLTFYKNNKIAQIELPIEYNVTNKRYERVDT